MRGLMWWSFVGRASMRWVIVSVWFRFGRSVLVGGGFSFFNSLAPGEVVW